MLDLPLADTTEPPHSLQCRTGRKKEIPSIRVITIHHYLWDDAILRQTSEKRTSRINNN
jgi:hypothetical protein